MPRRTFPDFHPVLSVLVLVLALGAIAVDILMPASSPCTVEGLPLMRISADGNTPSSPGPACMQSLAQTDRRFREP